MDVRLHPLEYTLRDLPSVCALTGEQAEWSMRTAATKATNPLLFLLVFLGPLGWIVLAFALGRTDETYVDIPVSGSVHDAIVERRRRHRWVLASVVVCLMAGVMGSSLTGITVSTSVLVAFFLPAVLLMVWMAQVPLYRIRVRIDAVGLVTIRNVHPDFVAAVDRWRQTAATRRP